MSAESRTRLLRAARAYARLSEQIEAAREELAAAIVEERREGVLIEDITALVPYRQTHVNRILKAAGLTEERPRRVIESIGPGVREQMSATPKFVRPPGDRDS